MPIVVCLVSLNYHYPDGRAYRKVRRRVVSVFHVPHVKTASEILEMHREACKSDREHHGHNNQIYKHVSEGAEQPTARLTVVDA